MPLGPPPGGAENGCISLHRALDLFVAIQENHQVQLLSWGAESLIELLHKGIGRCHHMAHQAFKGQFESPFGISGWTLIVSIIIICHEC